MTGQLSIKPVHSRSEQHQFLCFPKKLYGNDPCWVPPLWGTQRQLLGFGSHPFYDKAETQAFLAIRDGEICGRVAAIVNHAHNQRHGEKTGFFGFWECQEDSEVAGLLFQAAGSWLSEQGLERMRGPANPSLNYECGLLIEGFETPPAFMMTYNPPYYPRLLEDAGFQGVQDLLTFWQRVSYTEEMDPKFYTIAEMARERFDIKTRTLNPRRFRRELQAFLELYNQSLASTWGFVPLTKREADQLGADLQHLIVPELTSIAEVEGQPIGAILALLDYNPRIRQIGGRLFPFGFLRLLLGRRRLPYARILSANVVPEYQSWGVGILLINELIPRARRWPLEEVEFSWVLESNYLSRRTLERAGTIRTKTHRLYERSLTD